MPPFSQQTLQDWCRLYTPTTIEMSDNQYSYFAALMRGNATSYSGIPITFIDAPQPHV